jgi:hypothetical protein
VGDPGCPAASGPRGKESKAEIRRATGRTRNTVGRYVERSRKRGWDPTSGAEPDEALALKVARSFKAVGRKAQAEESELRLVAHREQIRQWLVPEDGSRGASPHQGT